MRTEIQDTKLYKEFIKALDIHDMVADDNPFVVKCCKIAEAYAALAVADVMKQRDELKEALIDMVNQFAYRGTYEGRENLHTGGLSALEDAFSALSISDPITVMDFEAAIKSTER